MSVAKTTAKLSKQDNSYWASNIRFLRNRHRLSQDELAQKLGITRSKLASHENGQTVNPPIEDLLRVSSFFKISIDNLIRTQLSRMSETKLRELESGNDAYIMGTQLRVLATTIDAENRDQIEFVPQKAQAGYLAGYNDPEFISSLPVFHLPHLPSDRKFRMFPTSGDSMYPVPENVFVIGNFVDDWKGLKPRTPGIVITKNDGIVFKLITIQLENQRTLLLESLNTRYKPYTVPLEDVLEIWSFVNYFSDQIPEAEMTLAEISRHIVAIRETLSAISPKK